MVPMSSIKLSIDEQQTCMHVAHESIKHGLQHGTKLQVMSSDYSNDLQQNLASFVTLHKNGALRGCIGALEAYQPLINDIAEHAFAAAFKDPRFPGLEQNEFEQLDIEISVLGKPDLIEFEMYLHIHYLYQLTCSPSRLARIGLWRNTSPPSVPWSELLVP